MLCAFFYLLVLIQTLKTTMGILFYCVHLFWCIIYQRETSTNMIIKTLLNTGTDPNVTDSEGHTPLLYGVLHACPNIVKLLLDYKADTNSSKQLFSS